MLDKNVEIEFARNGERYSFLRWGQQAFSNFRVVPPSIGIVHQVNLEYLAGCVFLRDDPVSPGGPKVAIPDTLVGTDSHTTMINGLGVVGWGVGGIEAEAVMLGQAMSLLLPEVVGFELLGRLPEGATATDLVLTVTEILRKRGVVGKFVEFFGSGLKSMSLADRATIANMAPEYGATMGFSQSMTRRFATCGSLAAARLRSNSWSDIPRSKDCFARTLAASQNSHRDCHLIWVQSNHVWLVQNVHKTALRLRMLKKRLAIYSVLRRRIVVLRLIKRRFTKVEPLPSMGRVQRFIMERLSLLLLPVAPIRVIRA